MTTIIAFLLAMLSTCSLTDKDVPKIIQSNLEFRADLNAEYADSAETPLLYDDWKTFTELPFYDIDTAFYVIAQFRRMENAVPFGMKTSTDRLPTYEVYGIASFTLKGQSFEMPIYQSHKSRDSEEYKDYLFLPYNDLTNGQGTYAGGRFIDLRIPKNDEIIIDFNQSYNPLCAYNHKYSCPIPPKENFMNVRIEAGVKYEDKYGH